MLVSDDQGILLFLGVGVVIIALIVIVGLLSSRRKRKTGRPSWSAAVHYLGEQPYIASSATELGDKRQWAMFQERYPRGAEISSVPVMTGDEESIRTLHVSHVQRSLRASWPMAKVGFSAYFTEYMGTDLPASFQVKGSRHLAAVRLDESGLTAMNEGGETVWASPWSRVRFSNGTDLVLKNDAGTIRIENPASGHANPLEELVIKYGTFEQMHF